MRSNPQTAIELQIAPLIDVCFLLLFFYLLTASDGMMEKTLAVPLPGTVEQNEPLRFDDVQQIHISALGTVSLNGAALDEGSSRDLPQLRGVLARFRESARSNKSEACVTLCPEQTVPYQRLIDVIQACLAEGIQAPLLAETEEESP
jgi:biopolymer transport protein ExbD